VVRKTHPGVDRQLPRWQPAHDPFQFNKIMVRIARLSMIFSKNRLPLFAIMLSREEPRSSLFFVLAAFAALFHHALAAPGFVPGVETC
jgi:hypothetical protein